MLTKQEIEQGFYLIAGQKTTKAVEQLCEESLSNKQPHDKQY